MDNSEFEKENEALQNIIKKYEDIMEYYNLRIEAVVIGDESFILTITRVTAPKVATPKIKKKFTAKRKSTDIKT